MVEGAGGGFEVGAGGAVEGAGAGGAGGLLERGRRRTNLVAYDSRGRRGDHHQEVAEGGDITGTFGTAGSGEEGRGFADAGVREGEIGGRDRGVEAFADQGQREVVGEGPTGEPDRARALVGAVAGQRDRVPVQGPVLVVVLAHAEPCVAEPGEEVGGAGGAGGGLADGALETLASCLWEAAAGGLLPLPRDRGAARCLVEGGHRGEAPGGLESAGGGVHAGDVAADTGWRPSWRARVATMWMWSSA
ncbi:hypothetical protein [Streptomyces californicus]|uniref:hypothetical protein n=1 Tax=Streptomyces californicus TaxID=67351 RepID=UPI003653BEE8